MLAKNIFQIKKNKLSLLQRPYYSWFNKKIGLTGKNIYFYITFYILYAVKIIMGILCLLQNFKKRECFTMYLNLSKVSNNNDLPKQIGIAPDYSNER